MIATLSKSKRIEKEAEQVVDSSNVNVYINGKKVVPFPERRDLFRKNVWKLGLMLLAVLVILSALLPYLFRIAG